LKWPREGAPPFGSSASTEVGGPESAIRELSEPLPPASGVYSCSSPLAQILERAAELGRREREAAPSQTSGLSLEYNLTAARAARDAQTAVALRAKADAALAEWQRRQNPAKSQDAEAVWEHTRTADTHRTREADRGIHYDPWDLSL